MLADMLRFSVAALAALFVWITGSPATAKPRPDTIAYTLSPIIEQGNLAALQVELRFRGDRRGQTILDLPDHFGGGEEAWRYVRDLSVLGARSVREDGPARRVIAAAPRASITVRYRVVSSIDHEPISSDGQAFLPWIRPTWFYAMGGTLLATPQDRDAARVTFDWIGAPAGFGFASDLEHLAGAHRRATRPGTINDVFESVVLGGSDVRVVTRMDHGRPIRVAIRGALAFSDAAFANQAERVIVGERDFWNDHDSPFLVTAAVVGAPAGAISISGTGRGDAFAMALTADSPAAMFRQMLAHEYFHTWNPLQMGGLEAAPKERLGYWFSEGFTDFYARRLVLRLGLGDPAAFAASWNEMLRAYAASPVRLAPNSRVESDFWKNGDVEKLPYQRGALLAAIWDQRLRQASGGRAGLDTLMRDQRRAARAYGRTAPGGAAALFATIARRHGLDIGPEVDRYIIRGDPIVLPGDVFGPCAAVEMVTRPAFVRGYDPAATEKAGNVVTGLDPTSPAYQAGLRDGMKLLAREKGEPGDSTQDYVLRVDDHGAQRLIRFRPAGKALVTLQQVVLTRPPGVDCARSLSGL